MAWRDPRPILLNLERDRIAHQMLRVVADVPDSGLRPKPRRSRIRQVQDGSTTFYAISAHELLEREDPSQSARPGHPLG